MVFPAPGPGHLLCSEAVYYLLIPLLGLLRNLKFPHPTALFLCDSAGDNGSEKGE